MKVERTAVLSAILLLSSLSVADAFFHHPPAAPTPQQRPGSRRVPGSSSAAALPAGTAADGAPCAGPNDAIPASVTARSLRTAVLTNADGDLVRLDEKMGRGTSIVVFLRHLGWPYCWTYANDWCKLQQREMSANPESGISGPIFVSIGDEEKLGAFLEKNPEIPRDQVLVDGYGFEAYKAAGFGKFDDVPEEVAKEAMGNMAAPELGLKGWWDYLTSAARVSPIPKDMKFGEFPEGVLRLGGTFVVSGDEIAYRWSDRLPGDHPDIEDVLEIARESSVREKGAGGDILGSVLKMFGR